MTMTSEQAILTGNDDASFEWKRKHLLDIDSFSKAEYDLVLETAMVLKEILSWPFKKVPS